MSENKADQLRAEMRGRHAAELAAPGWKGLHNEPNRHRARGDMDAWCDWCGDCAEDQPCRCCLAAEVEALREREAQSLDVNALLSELAWLRHGLSLLRKRRDNAFRTWQGYPEGTRGRKTWGKRLNALDAALADFDGGDDE